MPTANALGVQPLHLQSVTTNANIEIARSRFWAFVEACDQTQSARAVRELVTSTFRDVGIPSFAIVTHANPEDLRSFGVLLHNWPPAALDQLMEAGADGGVSMLMTLAEQNAGPMRWPDAHMQRDKFKRQQRQWFDRLRGQIGQREGVSQTLRSVVVGASCSLGSPDPLDLDRIRLCMRIGNYAYQQVLALQKPKLAEADQLTAREHEFLYRATILGERPADVARELDVKVSTVRTIRQKANLRLDAASGEQAAWRLLETGQLFRSGRTTRPRAR